MTASAIPLLKLYLMLPNGRSGLDRSLTACEQAYRGWMPAAMARRCWLGVDSEVVGGALPEGTNTGEYWGYCAQLFCCAEVGDGVLVNFVQWVPLLS